MNSIAQVLGVSGLVPIKGDASTRAYFRCDQGIVMVDVAEGGDARRSKFIDISERLLSANFRTPKVSQHIAERGLILMDDLGGVDLGHAPSDQNYVLALSEMLRFDEVNTDGLTHYSHTIYTEELSRLNRFYLAPLGIQNDENLGIASPYFDALSDQASRFVHVDYHAENLMICGDGSLGIIDFQDARFGHALYDLASLVDDIRVKVNPIRAGELMTQAFNKLSTPDADMWFHVLSVQRLLKVIGIFARLTSEGREGYDALLPRCFEILDTRLAHPELKSWKEWFDDIVPKFDASILTKLKGQP